MKKLWSLALVVQAAVAADALPGTSLLREDADYAARMVDGIHRFLDRETAAAAAGRESRWKRVFTSRAAYEASVSPNRERFRRIIGFVDPRICDGGPALDIRLGDGSVIARGRGYKVYAVRWPVFPGVDAEGLLLEPEREPVARVVALPDADWTPEAIAGLAPGLPPEAQYAGRLAEQGALVLVPVLIDRKDTFSGNAALGRLTNQPHREFIYRMAYEVGRHVIGYEVQKVLAAVDWFSHNKKKTPIGVFGYGEGGLIGLYCAASDTRIDTAGVSGYFGPREGLASEPIYRNVWGLLREFGDAEVAWLIAPRSLVIETAPGPVINGPRPETKERRGAAPGALAGPDPRRTGAEVRRALRWGAHLPGDKHPIVAITSDDQGRIGHHATLRAFLEALGAKYDPNLPGAPLKDLRTAFDPEARQRRQFDQLVDFTQTAVRGTEAARRKFWAKADTSSVEAWQRSTEWYRRYLWEEVIGRMPDPSEPLEARTRVIYERPNWTGYEVVLPVWPDVIAYGVLLVPKEMKPGERRPVVVCQHGLEGRPQDLVEPKTPAAENAYQRFAARLADRGFIVYAPQNPYIFETRFRQIQRKANPLKLSLFSFIIGQHQRTLEWLSSLPFVDPQRIGFYGLSYGGKTAMRVPPLLERYTLSICSGDFNEWIWKNTSVDQPFSYMFTQEYEMPEFDLGNTFNYAELASLMAPRPFMIERGHMDGVGIDEWVAYEYAKVRRFYTFLKIPDRTEIEYFDGPHTIHGVGTFRFLEKYLRWPE
jgi:dienelactone hydrolase